MVQNGTQCYLCLPPFDQQTLWFMHLTKYCHPHIAMPLIQIPYYLHAY